MVEKTPMSITPPKNTHGRPEVSGKFTQDLEFHSPSKRVIVAWVHRASSIQLSHQQSRL